MKIAIVGTCASGKTTIATELRLRGHDAYVVGQEHSVVHDLWNHQRPQLVVFLTADLETVRSRRGASWPGWLFDAQQQRLEDAREHANVVLDTSELSIDETVASVSRLIDSAANE